MTRRELIAGVVGEEGSSPSKLLLEKGYAPHDIAGAYRRL